MYATGIIMHLSSDGAFASRSGNRHLPDRSKAADMTHAIHPTTLNKQHVIDPEICIRCNTCEDTCPVGAVTHDDNNYVVDPDKCNFCLDCISPCPTGAIDNWRIVAARYSLDDQFGWHELPAQDEAQVAEAVEAVDDEAGRLIAEAHRGAGGKSVAPASATRPEINLYNRQRPAVATVTGNFRLTAPDADNDVRHADPGFRRHAPFRFSKDKASASSRPAWTQAARRIASGSIRSRALATARSRAPTISRSP